MMLRVTGRLGTFSGHPMLEHFNFVKTHTKRLPKMTIPSPSSLHFRYGRDAVPEAIYPDMDEFYRDLGQTYRKAVRAFADAGCRYLQLDEVNFTYLCDPKLRAQVANRGDDPEQLPAIYARMINAAIADIPPDMTIAMHLCRGNFQSTFVASGGYEPVAEILFNTINVHGYFMEYDSRPRRRLRAAAVRAQGQDRGARPGHDEKRAAGIEGRHQAPHRPGGEIRAPRSIVPVAAMRLRLDRGGQYPGRGRAMGEAEDDRGISRGSLGMKRTKPPFRADHVGSLLRPAALKKAREQRAKGEIDAAALKAVEDREIERVIGKQEEVGLQSITDGEFRRSWWHLDFLWGLDGVEKHVMDTGVAFAAVTTRNEGVKVTGKLGFSGHPMIEHFKFVAAHTKRTPKITIPAPSALYGRPMRLPIDQKIYPKLDALFDDLGQAYKKAVRAFADAGCRYLQLDEVFIAMLCDEKYRAQMKARGDDPERLGPLYGDLINTAMSDIPSDMTITMHLCRGNYKSTFMGSGGYEAEQEILFNRIKVHGYFMEYDSDRAGGFEPLKLVPKDRQVVLGLVTTKTGRLESKDDLKRRIDEAAKYISLDQLCLSPQCGFASTEEGNTLAEDEQWAKLRMIVEVAKEVWG